MGSISTLIYTSELIFCSIICLHSATRPNIHMYPYICFIYIENHCDTRRWVTINIQRVNYITISKEDMKLHRQITNELIGQEEIEMFIH